MWYESRLRRLERRGGRPACVPPACGAEPTFAVRYRRGDPVPAVPADAPRCPHCGEVHLLEIVEVLVRDRGEWAALQAELGAAALGLEV